MTGRDQTPAKWVDLFGIDPTYGKDVSRVPEPGDTLYGFCGGAFGRDSYGDKIVIAVGRDWLVARESGQPVFATGDPSRLGAYLTEEDDDDR